MKKQFSWIVLFIAISLISCIFGCKEPEIETDTKAPANVTKLTVTAADGNAVLTWKNPSDADFDGVQVSMSPAEGTLLNPVILGKNVTSLNVSGLTSGKEYTFTVKTIDTSNNKSSGVSAKVTVADYTAPADVTELTVQAENGNAVLNWKNPTDADFAGVQISMNPPEGTLLNPVILGKNVTSLNVGGLTSGKEYTFTVKTIDTSGNKSQGVTISITPSIIEKSILQIALEPNTTERTNKDVVITVNATTDSASEIKNITYVEGTESNIDTVLAGTNITETKQITATENTTFTVAVTDTAGRCELAFVTVNNIDKAAPAQVANVMPSYSRNDNTIKLSWTNPADKDFAGTEIVYGKTDSEKTTTLTFDKSTTSATIENIADDDSEYTIAIKTKDDVGNLSEAKTITVLAATGAKIASVNLDRTHLDSIMTNRDIEVTISGSNFDLLKSLLVQVTDGTKAETPVTATIDAANNTATATVTAPVSASPTNNGTTYTVKVIVDSITPAEKTATFVVSLPAAVTKISLAKTQIPVGTQESVTATITGYNFDIRGVTKVKLLDSNGDEYTESTVTVPLESNTSKTKFTANIPLPTTEGVYTVAVFFDDVKDATTTTLQVYGAPIISKVTIPVAGTSYGGNVLPVTIKGKNFTAPDVTESGFTSTGATLTNVKIISDTKATAEVTCPYAVGTTNVTVSYGESSATTILKVIAAEKCFVVGDVLLTNGTRIKAENVQYGLPSGKNAFAVIVSAPYGGGGKAIGLQKGNSLMWAQKGTTGYNRNFTEIQASYRNSSSSGRTFEGDIDGSDNWEEICAVDPEGSQDAATNYPIFNFANTYGTTAGLTGTDYETGWYVPSVAEVYEVYKNKDVIQISLDAAKGFTLGTSYYWSSSQDASVYGKAYQVDFYYPSVYGSDKGSDKDVFVLQALNGEQFNNYEYNTEISTVEIPTIAEGFVGEVPVTIRGKDLIQKITVSGLTISRIDYISDVLAIAYATTTGTETTITVSCGTASATGTLKVLAAEKCFVVGDVLLTDGTLIKAENVQYGLPSGKNAFAVIASAPYGGGTGKAIGLQKSELRWAKDGTTGYNTNFTKIKASYSGSSSSGYTFEGDIDGSDNWEYICSIDPEGTQDAATNYPIFNFANTYGTTAGLTGTDYETGWYVPSVAEVYEVYKNKDVIQISLYAAKGFTLGTSDYWSSSQIGIYAYQVYFDSGSVGSNRKSFWNYVFVLQALNGEQFNNYEYNTEISSVEIPTIAEGFVGEVPVTITGKDLIQKITVSGLTISRIDYISDAKAIAYATTTGTETETTITVSCGTASATGTLKVIAAEKCFSVGDIILTDGSKVSVNDIATYTIDENNNPIGVVAMISDIYGVPTPKVIGLQKSARTLMWAPKYTTGYSTKFTNIVCTPSQTGKGAALTATFTGDTDGSDNWEEICAVDPTGTANAATNYPIFNFANTYGTTAGLIGTDYENGWYVPSIAELCQVYKNKEVIQTSLTKANGFNFGTSDYWSSSQSTLNNNGMYSDAYRVNFNNGYVDDDNKYYADDVFVLQALTAK